MLDGFILFRLCQVVKQYQRGHRMGAVIVRSGSGTGECLRLLWMGRMVREGVLRIVEMPELVTTLPLGVHGLLRIVTGRIGGFVGFNS